MRAGSPRQLELDFAAPRTGSATTDGSPEAHGRRVASCLTLRLPECVDVVFTENRSTMISFRRRGGRLAVRLHRMFRHADEPVLDALARFIGNRDARSSEVLDAFIAEHQQEVRARPARQGALDRPAKGRHHDLRAALARVGATYFGGSVDVGIGWGRAPSRGRPSRRRRSRSRALATYSYSERTIRVSPVLDSADVPEYVVDWIVYHEILHHVLPVEEADGKRRYHTERFRLLERAFAEYDAAKAWELRNLERLLT